MTSIRMKGFRALAALLLLAVLIGAISQVSAQDAVDTANDAATPASYGGDPVDVPIESDQTSDEETDEVPVDDEEVPSSETDPDASVEDSTDEDASEEEPSTPEADPVISDGGIEASSTDQGYTTDEVIEIPQIQVAFVDVYVFDCDVDPGSSDPALSSDCAPSQGVEILGIANQIAVSDFTDANGWVAFGAEIGTPIDLTEVASTIPTGYRSIGSGSATVIAGEVTSFTFVNLAEEIAGRLQIVNGSCPTTGESRTEFRVIEPQSFAAASTPACQATGGTVFTIVGSSGSISVATGSDGAWRGYLVPGEYTVIDDSGASASVTVIANDISVVIVVDYLSAPLGLLNVSRFACTVDGEAGTEISFGLTEPTVGDDDGCESTDGEIAIDIVEEVSAADVTTIILGSDGIEEIELPGGSYILTDMLTGASASFVLQGGTRLYAVVQELKINDDGVGGGDPDGSATATATPTETPDDGTGGGGGTEPTPTETPDDGDGSGTDNGTGGGGGDNTDGDVDTGSSDDGTGDDGDEVSGVTTLPSAGAHISKQEQTQAYLMLALLAAALSAGAFGGRRLVLRRVDSR